MASIVLGKIGGSIGGAIGGGLASNLGSILGNFAGQALDRKIFGTPHNITEGRKLENLSIQTAGYGEPIPLIYGSMRLAGNLIWASKIKETPISETESTGSGYHTHQAYSYSISVAVAICEGVIAGIDKIWANSALLNTNAYNMRIYYGNEEQLPDPLIESIRGIGKTPAYRGLAYVVFEDLQLSEFGNRLPNFCFEVKKYTSPHNIERLEELIEGIVMIPGSGEFVYDTIAQSKIIGDEVGTKLIQRGGSTHINQHSISCLPDSIVSLNHAQETLHNLKWVAPVSCWFANSLDIATCQIIPGIEFRTGGTTSPDEWKVGPYNRSNAYQISSTEGRVNYGGSINDQSIVRYLAELKSRGIKTMFYPMFLMDVPEKPWRGRLTGGHEHVSHFFHKKHGYNDFILHYAHLTKDYVDAFIIGSELVNLTTIRAKDGTFPAVDQLIELAGSVKKVMGSKTKIIYAADWSEYHHTDGGWYHLDPLWASHNIDIIGIDSYFPLTDSATKHELKDIIHGWDSGEGYDFYYADSERTIKKPLDPPYAWKNIEWWWANDHYNPDGTKTKWIPKSKKIWFTEFGFPSINGASNQPNVFFDASSKESGIPRYSSGDVDFTAQRLGLYATEKRWRNSEMIEQKFVWCWDARPYPSWPSLDSVWSDAPNWIKGHWVQGKLSPISLSHVLSDLCIKAGLKYEDFDVTAMAETSGMDFFGCIIDGQKNLKRSIEILQNAFFFDVVEHNGKLKFLPRKSSSPKANISVEHLITDANSSGKGALEIKRLQDAVLPERLSINYINKFTNYSIETQYHTANKGGQNINFNLPIVSDRTKVHEIAKTILHNMWLERIQYCFTLPMSYLHLSPADVIILRDDNHEYCMRIVNFDIGKNGYIKVSGVGENLNIYAQQNSVMTLPEAETVQEFLPGIEVLDIPALPWERDINHFRILVACYSNNESWSGCRIIYSGSNGIKIGSAEVKTQATIGQVIEQISPQSPYLVDKVSEITVNLIHGQLLSMKKDELFGDKNLAIIGNEIVQFQKAKLVKANQYKISYLLRGQCGTEHEINQHKAGERFVLLNNQLASIKLEEDCLGRLITWEINNYQVTQNSSSSAIECQMSNLKPLSPVNIRVEEEENFLIITWTQRDIFYGVWRDFGDALSTKGPNMYNLKILVDNKVIIDKIIDGEMDRIDKSAISLDDITRCKIEISQISPLIGLGVAAKWPSYYA